MRAYLLRLICAAFVCALLDAVADGPGQKTRRMVAGMFLTMTALSFPNHLDLPDFDFDRILRDAEAVVAMGEAQAQDARKDIITDAYAAYILTEAKALGLDVQIDVSLKDDLSPERITLTGTAQSSVREALRKIIAENLGVGEEDVIWKDLHQSSA